MTDLWIDGRWQDGKAGRLESLSPADHAEIWSGRAANAGQVAEAVSAAAASFPAWSRRPLEDRIAVVRAFAHHVQKHAEDLAALISREMGKPVWEAETEVRSVVAKVAVSVEALLERRWTESTSVAGGRAVTRYRPHGVMLVLGPFNFPAHLPNGHIVPALLAGNTVCFKPSEQTPAVGRWIARAWEQSGLPSGVLNLILGAADVATAAIDDPRVAGVLFTGSYRTGRAIHRQLADRPEVLLALEMGGNNPLVVVDPQPAPAAATLTILSAFLTSGQRCTCARRLIVVESQPGREFVDVLMQRISRIRMGLPDGDPPPLLGPLVSAAAAQRVVDQYEELVERGASVVVPLERSKYCPALLSPGMIDVTTVEDPPPDDEIFGPLLQMRFVPDLDAAIDAANATRFGLAAGLLGGDAGSFEKFVAGVHAGVVNWNRATTGASSRLPFGGIGHSGNHRPSAYHAADYCAFPVASLEAEVLAPPESLPPGWELE